MTQVITQEVFSQVPVPVMKPVDVLVLTPVVSPWRGSATDRGLASSCASGDDAG